MFKKGTKMYSIFYGKCPRCHEGDFFKHGVSYHPTKISKLHDNCSHCGQKYMLEPSFYYGAMYINYGITVALCVACFVIFNVFVGLNLLETFGAIVLALLILAPLNIRIARILWINMFVSYNPEAKSEKLN